MKFDVMLANDRESKVDSMDRDEGFWGESLGLCSSCALLCVIACRVWFLVLLDTTIKSVLRR